MVTPAIRPQTEARVSVRRFATERGSSSTRGRNARNYQIGSDRMAVITVKRNHKLGAREARAAVDKVAQKLRKELDADCRWVGSSLQFTRSGASGQIDVNDEELEVNIKLGMVLSPLKRKIEKSIEEEIDQHLTA